MTERLSDRRVLRLSQDTMELDIDRHASETLILHDRLDAVPVENLQQLVQAPRGRARCLGRSSPQAMTRGLPNVERRIACAL